MSRWSDQNIVMYERYDNREGTNGIPSTQAVVLFGMNDDFGYPGDITFDDGVTNRISDGYYLVSTNTGNGSASADTYLSNSRHLGIVVGFPPGTVLTQLSSSGDVAALKANSVFTTKDQAGAIAFASPLSYPLVADQLPALVANILH